MSVPFKLVDLRRAKMVSPVALAAGVFGLLTGTASAQGSAPDGFSAASGLEGVQSHTLLDDGSVQLVMQDGSTMIIPASDVAVVDGVVYVDASAMGGAGTGAAAAAGGGGGGGAIGVLAGAGLLGAAAGGAGGGGGGGGSTGGGGGGGGGGGSNTAPSFTSATSTSYAENQSTVVYTAAATDSDGDSLTYAISGGADASLFTINTSNGTIRFVSPPDFENPGDANNDNVYEIVVRVSDGTVFVEQTVTITVTDQNEAPVITSNTAYAVAENQTVAFTGTATDPESDSVTFSLEGADASLFNIDASTGAVTFKSAPDFENPADADSDNIYEVTLVASDGASETRQSVSVTVTNVSDSNVVITSGGSSTVSENQTSAYVIRATGDEGATLTYSISGTDAALFNVDSETGEVSFKTAPDFESPSDAGGNGVYDIVVGVSDGGAPVTQAVQITISDVTDGAEVPADDTTEISMVSGGSYEGELETPGDSDWIAIELVAGQRYEFNLFGSGADEVEDTYLRIYDASGNLLVENDDISLGTIRDSRLGFTPTVSGTYYIEADAWADGTDAERTGGYTVTVAHTDPLRAWTTSEIADYLDSNGWNGAQWDISTGDTLTVDITGLTAAGQTLARAALQVWTDATGINFVEVSSGGDITFDDEEEGAFAGPTSIVGGFFQGATVNIGTGWLDDYGTGINTYSFQTYIHEIGHALGLGHAGPYDGSADYGTDAIYLNDSWQITVMSYFHQDENTFVDASFAFVLTPQLADLLAVQNMYGGPVSTRAGDTTYGFNSNAGNVIFDATSFGTITSYTIIDTSGTDTMDYSGSAADQVLDLRQDHYSSLQGGVGNVAIAIGTVIENAIGGSGDDILIGNSANNTLTGGTGADTFYASGGSDVFNGGAGTDEAIFTGASSDYSVTVNGSGNTVVTDLRVGGPDGTVELISVETITYGGLVPDLARPSFVDPDAAIISDIPLEDFGARGCCCKICTSFKDGESASLLSDAFYIDGVEPANDGAVYHPWIEAHTGSDAFSGTTLTADDSAASLPILDDWAARQIDTVGANTVAPPDAVNINDVAQVLTRDDAMADAPPLIDLGVDADLTLPPQVELAPETVEVFDPGEGWL